MNWRGGKMKSNIKVDILYNIEDVINEKHSMDIEYMKNIPDFDEAPVSFVYNTRSRTFCLSSDQYTLRASEPSSTDIDWEEDWI